MECIRQNKCSKPLLSYDSLPASIHPLQSLEVYLPIDLLLQSLEVYLPANLLLLKTVSLPASRPPSSPVSSTLPASWPPPSLVTGSLPTSRPPSQDPVVYLQTDFLLLKTLVVYLPTDLLLKTLVVYLQTVFLLLKTLVVYLPTDLLLLKSDELPPSRPLSPPRVSCCCYLPADPSSLSRW